MKDIYIIGAGGFGREVADTIHDINSMTDTYRIIGFIDDDQSKWGHKINGIEVKGGADYLLTSRPDTSSLSASASNTYGVISIGSPGAKEAIAKKLDGILKWENIIHPTSIVSEYAEIGSGNIFQAYTLVNANVRVGNHCMMNLHSYLGHDAVIGDYVSIMCHCGVMGNCKIGDRVFVSSSACMIPGITVADDALLGAGSVVIRDVEPGITVVGNPARPK